MTKTRLRAVLAAVVGCLVVVGSATAAAPSVVTGPVTGSGQTSATVTGSVNPNGRSTTWYFQYGTSTGYGSTTAAQNAGSGTSPVNVSAPVSGLTTGQTYHFRLVATSDGGTSRGSDQTFTPASAPSVTTNPASSVTTTSARLNG